MIKSFVNRFISRKLHSKSRFRVDYVFKGQNATVISGWFLDKEKVAVRDIGITTASGKLLNSDVFCFDRNDVVQNFGVASSAQVFGYICVIHAINLKPNRLRAVVNGNSYSLATSKSFNTTNLNVLIGQALEQGPLAKDFVERFGLSASENMPLNSVPIVVDKDIEKIKEVLGLADVYSSTFYDDCIEQYIPRLHRVWEARLKRSNYAIECIYGELPLNPKVSIVIPLYGRIDFLQHQIACFNDDPYFKCVEIVYVLDDPRLKRELEVLAEGVHKVFDIGFKVVYSECNQGFSGANNLGVKYAKSEKLLLLNSDIIPCTDGWLSTLVEQFESKQDCGILAATLLYEDRTIQHIGMEFQVDTNFPNIWLNSHPYKGFPISLVDEFEIKEVPLVTGACMLIEKSLYRSVGGFDQKYILGDFEDSDLCLKCKEKGLKIYISGKVSLYHLERLSQNLVESGDWKFKLTMLNGVYQSSKWSNLIKELS